MKDFILAALPWIVMGVTVAIVMANFSNKKKISNTIKEKNDFK